MTPVRNENESDAERVLELYGTIAEDSWFEDDITPEMFPNAQRQYETTLTIPLWPDMPEDMVEYTANTIISICKEHYVR